MNNNSKIKKKQTEVNLLKQEILRLKNTNNQKYITKLIKANNQSEAKFELLFKHQEEVISQHVDDKRKLKELNDDLVLALEEAAAIGITKLNKKTKKTAKKGKKNVQKTTKSNR